MGLIPDDVIDEIRAKADIVSIVGQYVQLKKAGRSHKGLCPFHGEKTPSFNVHGDKGFFYCFGCQKKGDVFTFLMEHDGLSFVEAAEKLAATVGIVIERTVESPQAARLRSERARMLEVNKLAAGFFREQLTTPAGARAREYLAGRGIGDEVAEAFALGYAPDGWRQLGDFLAAQRVPAEIAIKLGLVARQPRAGGVYDRFRDRVVCPVILPGGEIAGFSARRLAEGDGAGAKYINSPESPVYKKSKLLFGLHLARQAFRERGRAILVEGNFDVVSLHQAGFPETVAPLGTALTVDQVELIRRLADQVVLVYDGDRAGRAATLKALDMFLAAEAKVSIAALPAGEDPDTLVRSDRERFAALVERAQPAVEYFAYDVWAREAARSPEGKAEALAEAGRVVRNVADPVKRDLIIGTLAAAMGLDHELVRRAMRRGGRQREDAAADSSKVQSPGPRSDPPSSAPPPRAPEDELVLLAILADHPQLMETAEQHDVFSLLTDARLRDMYCAARRGQPMLSAVPEDSSPLIAKHVLAGSFANVRDPEHSLLEAVAGLKRVRNRIRLAELQKQAMDAGRRGDVALERRLYREIVTTRRQVD